MIIVGGKELQWQEGLTIQDLALQTGGAPGTSFAAIVTPLRTRLVSRLEWPATQIPDGVTIRFIIIPSGG